jgi:hypothetical protein
MARRTRIDHSGRSEGFRDPVCSTRAKSVSAGGIDLHQARSGFGARKTFATLRCRIFGKKEPKTCSRLVAEMSKRGTEFLQQWLADNVPTLGADMTSIVKATEKLFRDAEKQGIHGGEIVEDNDSVYEAILHAVVHYHHEGLAG